MSNNNPIKPTFTHLNALALKKYCSAKSTNEFITTAEASQIQSTYGQAFYEDLCPCADNPSELCPCEGGVIVDTQALEASDINGNNIQVMSRKNGNFYENTIGLYSNRDQITVGDKYVINIKKTHDNGSFEIMTLNLLLVPDKISTE